MVNSSCTHIHPWPVRHDIGRQCRQRAYEGLGKGQWTVVQNLDVDDFSCEKMTKTEIELKDEREAVKDVLP